jgi:hypothetical protein
MACSGSGGQGLTVSAPKAAPRQGGAPGPSHSEGEVVRWAAHVKRWWPK